MWENLGNLYSSVNKSENTALSFWRAPSRSSAINICKYFTKNKELPGLDLSEPKRKLNFNWILKTQTTLK